MPIDQLSKIITLDNFEFINLQYGDTSTEQKMFKEKYGKELINIEDLDIMNDFEGMAAVISCCDLVLTIDNLTAHLAGSIGKSTLTMLYKFNFWQWFWFYNKNYSPWYPNVKIFRQKTNGNWLNVVDRVSKELKNK